MPIRKIKAQSPDPYLGKINGDTELARLAHLNNIVDQINAAGIAGAYSTVEENGTPLPQRNTINFTGDGVNVSDIAGETVVNIPGGGGGGSITVNGVPNITNLNIEPGTAYYDGTSLTVTIDPYPGQRVYRAKIATESVNWPGYGYLYNWYAVDDVRGLANPSGGTGLTAPNEWRVPSGTDWDNLRIFISGSTQGGKLKSTLTSTAYPFYGWLNNTGATDNYNFNGLGGGLRTPAGEFLSIADLGIWWTSTATYSNFSLIYQLQNLNNFLNDLSSSKQGGYSVRLVREAGGPELALPDGATSDSNPALGPYTGNDGKTYVTVKIGTQIWLAQNLRETKYNDNSDITNCGQAIGGDGSDTAWVNAGTANDGAVTTYIYNGMGVPYDPRIFANFYNDVLENTFSENLIWVETTLGFGPIYALTIPSRPWNKTHIKITPAWHNDDSLAIANALLTENSLIIQNADAGVYSINFFPFKRNIAGLSTSQHLNNYKPNNSNNSYVYLEVIEYVSDTPYYYSGGGLLSGIGVTNLEEEEELLTYEINGVTYTEDPEVKRLSKIYMEIYKRLGIELNPTNV